MNQSSLLTSLESVRRRVRWLTALFGIGLLLTAAVTLLLITVCADYLLNLYALPRLVLVVAALGAVGYASWKWVIQSMLSRLSLSEVAGRIEKTFPQYQDRLRSTTDILLGNDVPGSDLMKQRTLAETTRLTQSLDLSQVVVTQPVWYSAGAGSAALGIAVLIALINPQYTRIAMDRLTRPFAANPWPKIVELGLVGNVPSRVAVGQQVDVNMRLFRGDNGSRKATIFYQYADASGTNAGPVEQEYMTRGDDGLYHASIDARTAVEGSPGTMKFWIESGDGRLEPTPVAVVQRLSIRQVDAQIIPPPYSQLPAQRVSLTQGPATLTLGSKVQLHAEFNKPLAGNIPVTAELLSAKSKPVFTWQTPVGSGITASVDATESFRFHLHATDTDGQNNTAAEEFEFVVKPDQNPTVVIENPRRNEDRTPESTVPLQAVAEDDFGIESLKLIVDRIGDKKHWEFPLVTAAAASAGTQWNRIDSGGDLQRFRANYSWPLSSLSDAKLQSGDVLEYYALVKDNFALDGKSHPPVPSGKLRITIISQEEFNNKITDELSSVAEQTSALKLAQGLTQRQTSELAKEMTAKPDMDSADKVAADRLAGQQSTIASQTKSLANKLTDLQNQLEENKSTSQDLKDTARDVHALLDSAAENPMKNAAGDINTAKQALARTDRDQALSDAQTSQAKAGDDLQKVMDRMGNIGSLSRSIESVRSLLAEQQKISSDTAAAGKNNLGKSPDQISPQDMKKISDLAKQQADLASRTGRALEEIAKDAQKLSKSDPAGSKAMSQAADTGSQQNVTGNQAKAAQATQQNQQSQAQSAQKQAELGLQMMLANLKEAEKHKLDELARKLTALQEQIAILIRQQAGHNLDNLALQGGTTLANLNPAVKLDLFTQAERDPRQPVAVVEPGMLSSAQEQSERNARDISKSAQDLPDGGEPADLVSQAADKMERAIVNLREGKLAMAYNPAQTDALAALLKAKKIVDQQKQKADQKQEDQKKENLRQAYMALLAQQNEVNARTLSIDSVPRDQDGALPRQAVIRLNQLPGDQSKVSTAAAKMDDDLSALGSVVYSWANQQIVKNMNQVKDQLVQKQTGVAVQSQQKQIVAQLEAMIRDLATKPEQSKFAMQSGSSGGAGSSGSGSNMPTEAELRLIKDLQIAENDATISVAKQKDQPKADLLSLGDRQGDLRGLLDRLLQKASKGQSKLPPEPENKDALPEEAIKTSTAAGEKVDNDELEQDLIGTGKVDKPGQPPAQAQHDLALIGDRMARAKQRLAMNSDPGPITQEIQKRILDNMDDLIEQARKKEAQAQNQPPQPGGKPKQQDAPKPDSNAKPEDAQAKGQKQQQQPAQAKATGNNPGGGDGAPGQPGPDLARQEARMWGSVTPRQRDAVIESQGEKVLDKYRNLVDDYYRNLSTRANGH